MKKLTVAFIFNVFTLFAFSQDVSTQTFYKTGSFVIKGHAKNFKDSLFNFGMTTYFKNMGNSVIVLPNGNFEQQFPIQHRQDIHLYLNGGAITFTVQDKDTLTFEWDDADFKNTFSIKENNELRIKELNLQWKLYAGFRKPFLALDEKLYSDNLTPENKYKLVNDLYNLHVAAVFDSIGFMTDNVNDLITGLYFQYTNLLWKQHLIPKFKLELNLDRTRSYPEADVFEIAADYTRLNEIWFWNCPGYRDFIFDYVRFNRPFNSSVAISNNPAKPFNPTLDEFYLAQSTISLTTIKDWFITQSIMKGFKYYAFDDVEKVYEQAINTITSSYLKDTLQKYYTVIKERLKPGSPAPEFTLKNDKGQSVSLSDFKGKVVYIDFWGAGCAPCIYDIKNHVPKLHEHYKNKDVAFLNICVDLKDKEWKEALVKYKLDGVNMIAEGWTDHPVCKAYYVTSIPHYILIDKSGNMANKYAPRASEFNFTSGKNEIDLLLK